MEVRHRSVALPFTVFDHDQQRVTQAAIIENKHLSAVLEHIRAEQEKAGPEPKRKRGPVQRTRYTPNGRRNDGWNSPAARQQKATGDAGDGARAAGRACDP